MDRLLSISDIGEWRTHPYPQAGKNVWPRDSCPNYLPRRAIMADKLKQCWYCRYADFHLNEEVALEVGICCFPKVQSQ